MENRMKNLFIDISFGVLPSIFAAFIVMFFLLPGESTENMHGNIQKSIKDLFVSASEIENDPIILNEISRNNIGVKSKNNIDANKCIVSFTKTEMKNDFFIIVKLSEILALNLSEYFPKHQYYSTPLENIDFKMPWDINETPSRTEKISIICDQIILTTDRMLKTLSIEKDLAGRTSQISLLHKIRTETLKVAYKIKKKWIILPIFDSIVVFLSFFYSFWTFWLLYEPLKESIFNKKRIIVTTVIVILIGVASLIISLRWTASDSFVTPYSMTFFIFISGCYSYYIYINIKKLPRENNYLKSLFRFFCLGSIMYFLIFGWFSYSYSIVGYTVGSDPFKGAKLNISALFLFIISMIICLWIIFNEKWSFSQKLLRVLPPFIIGPFFTIFSIFFYYGSQGSNEYPKNIIYWIFKNLDLYTPEFIEIVLPRLIFSSILFFILIYRIFIRYYEKTNIINFLKEKGDSPADIRIFLDVKAKIRKDGVLLFPL